MSEYPRSSKSSTATLIIALILALAFIAVAYWLLHTEKPAEQQVKVVAPVISPAEQPAAATPETPIVNYEPPQQVVQAEPLPALNESDATLLEKLKALGSEGMMQLIVGPELIRKFVMAVNGVSEGKIVTEYRPISSPPPPFLTETFSVVINGETADQERISSKNFDRYEPYVTALALLDSDAAVSLYKQFYPLLEEAFKELGLKKSNFHSVMIAAIDNLLAAPNVEGDLLLIHPKVFYQFADPALEKMPQTHKLMVRMGPENERSAKASLRQLRAKLMAQ